MIVWIYEDKGASVKDNRDFYLDQARRCDLFIFIHHSADSPPVIDELMAACEENRNILCYLRKGVDHTKPEEVFKKHKRDPKWCRYENSDEIVPLIKQDLVDHLAESARVAGELWCKERIAAMGPTVRSIESALASPGPKEKMVFEHSSTLTKSPSTSQSDQAILNAALAAYESGDQELAIRISEEAVAAGPVDVTILANLGVYYAEEGHFEEAVQVFTELQRNGSLWPGGYAPFGASLHRLMKFDEALPMLEAALAHEPNDLGSKLRLAVTLAALDNHERARTLLRELEEAYGPGKSEVLLPLALMADDEEEFDAALPLYEAVLENDSGPEWVRERHAIAAFRSGRLEKALESIEHLQLLDPEHGLLPVLPGLYLEVGDFKAAQEQVDKRKQAGLMTSIEYVASGQLMQAIGDREGALAEYRLASKLDPSNDAAYLGEADILRESDKLMEALPLYRNHVQKSPWLAGTWSNYGVCASHLDYHDEAIAAHKEAIKLEPNEGTFHYNLGCALALANYADDARRAIRRSFDLRPSLRKIAETDEDLVSIQPID